MNPSSPLLALEAFRWDNLTPIMAVSNDLTSILYEKLEKLSLDAEDDLNAFYSSPRVDQLQRLRSPTACLALIYQKPPQSYRSIASRALKGEEGESVKASSLSKNGIALINGASKREYDPYFKASRQRSGPPLAIENWDAFVDLIDEALTKLQCLSPAASVLVDHFVWSVEAFNDSPYYGSGSTGEILGRIFIRNPFCAKDPLLAVTESLIHEGIHHFLNVQEIRQKMINVPLKQGAMFSRWTGNLIEPHSLLHACFVWYGLFKFLSLPGARDLFDAQEVNKLRSTAVFGFLQGGSLLEPLASQAESVHPEVQIAVRLMQDELRATEFARFFSGSSIRAALIRKIPRERVPS